MTSHPLSVLLLGLNYAPEQSGIAPYATGIATGLQRRGHRVTVMTTFPHYPQWRRAEGYSGWATRETLDGVDVHRLRHYVPARPSMARRIVSEVTFGSRLVARGWGDPDVVICLSPALLSSAMAIARPRRGRRAAVGLVMQDLYSAGISETTGSGGGLERAASAIESWTARSVDGVAVIHQRFRDRVVGQLGVPVERVQVIRNWTHLPAFGAFDRSAFRRAMGWLPHQRVVLHAGAMGEKQALGNVVDAARLADQRRDDVLFVLVGDGGQRAELERRAAGVERIRFVDPLPGEEYSHALRAADMLLVNEKPGVREMAVPSKLTSYFSTGVPVLAATDAGSTTAEEVDASGAGVRVDAGNPVVLLDGVEWLGSDALRARRIGARGPGYCTSVLGESTAMDSYERWIEHLVGARDDDRAAGTTRSRRRRPSTV